MSVKLIVPGISQRPDPQVEVRAVYLEEWVEQLPLANPPALLRMLLDALTRFNRSPVKPGLRLALLEHYVTAYHHLLELQEEHGPIRSIAALEKHRADSDATRHVAEELAIGYKVVLTQSPSKRRFRQNKEAKLAAQRACLFLSFALLHSYDEYLPTPAGLWEELTAVYLYAVENGLHDTAVPSKHQRGEFQQSTETAYKRILLTSLVDPFHLSYGEIWKVHEAFADCADQARLGPVVDQQKPAGIFIVDPHEDHRPANYAEAKDLVTSHCLLLDANEVLETLRARQAELKLGTGAARANRALLGHMIRSLSLPPKRHTPREDSEGRVNLATGLRSVYHFLGGAVISSPAMAAVEVEGDLGTGLEGGAAPASPGGHTAEFWDLVNQGPGGIGVLKRIRPTNTIGVGELLAIQFPLRGQSGTDWSIGTVRWLSIGNGGDYHAGVQILAKSATAVSIEASTDGGEPRTSGAIAVPGIPSDKAGALITPTGFYAPQKPLVVNTPGGPLRVVPESLIESTTAYDRFSYRIDS